MRSWSRQPARKILTVEELESRLVPVAGNIAVTNNQNLQIYSPTGVLLSSEPIPTPTGGDTPARDLIAAFNDVGEIVNHVYNGTGGGGSDPFLSTWNESSWTDLAGPAGWSTVNANHLGGIAAITHYVFATDMDVSGDGKGIIRWDLDDDSSARFANTIDFADLTIGLDGNLYALTPYSNGSTPQEIHVFNPFDMSLLDVVDLQTVGPKFRGIAVNETGQIFAVSWDTPDIYRFSPTGQQQRHRALESGDLNNLLDIDVSDDGWLVIGNDKAFVVRLKEASLTGNNGALLATKNYQVIQVLEPGGTDPAALAAFVAWADPQEITLPHVTVSGLKFEDRNANGTRNTGEPALAGWTIFADLNENGNLDLDEPSTVTNSVGKYTLDVVIESASSFRLMEQQQSGWGQTFHPGAGADEPTALHPYYTFSFADGDQKNKNFSNHVTNFVITPLTGLKTAENGFAASFTVVLTAPPTADVTIPVSSSNPGEGTVAITDLTFTDSNWDVPQIVTVTGQGDAGAPDGNATYAINLGPSDSLDPNYDNLAGQSVSVTNFDSTPIDKVGIFRGLPRRWTLDSFNDGVYSPGLDRRYVNLGGGRTLVGDWNGDGYDDLGLFRPKTGTFVLFVNGTEFKKVVRLDGKTGGKPLVGNWDGILGDEIGLFRGGVFTLDIDGDWDDQDADDRVGGLLDGKAGGTPLVGNWDGLGGDEVGIYRPGNGVFTLDVDLDLASQDLLDDTVITRLANKVGGRPLVGDWDGVGGDNVGLFFSLSGKWYLDTNSDPLVAEILIQRLDGAVGGSPIVGDFDGNGVTDCGLFRVKPGKWTIDLNNNGVFDAGVDLLYRKADGARGGRPLVGKWDF